MSSPNLQSNILQSDWKPFRENYTKYRKVVDEVSESINHDMLGYLRHNLLDFGFMLPEGSTASVQLVLDTNVLFRQILGRLKGYPSSLVRMVQGGFLELYAPRDIKSEIMEKIEEKMAADKQDSAKGYAIDILSRVNIVHDLEKVIKRNSQKLLGWRDPDDVSFLGVTIQKGAHGILTYDRDFEDISGLRIWKVGELGEVVTGIRRGAFTIWIFSRALPFALLILGALVSMILEGIAFIGRIILDASYVLAMNIGKLFWSIPPYAILVPAAIAFIAAVLSQKCRDVLSQGFSRVSDWVVTIGSSVRRTIQELVELFRVVLSLLAGYAPKLVGALGYLAYDASTLIQTLDELENSRLSKGERVESMEFERLMAEIDRIGRNLFNMRFGE